VARGVELASILLTKRALLPKRWRMRSPRTLLGAHRRLAAVALALAAGLLVGGCGTPAVVSAPSPPLPGLQRDIRAAQHAVATTEQQERSAASAAP
jgi:uncharacterized lipoprotein YajG